MKHLMKITTIFILLGALNLYAGENYKATVIMEDGEKYEVTIKDSPDAVPIVKIKKRPVPFSEIDSIELIGKSKTYIRSTGQTYSQQQVRVYLINNKKYRITLENFDRWLKESTSQDWNKDNTEQSLGGGKRWREIAKK